MKIRHFLFILALLVFSAGCTDSEYPITYNYDFAEVVGEIRAFQIDDLSEIDSSPYLNDPDLEFLPSENWSSIILSSETEAQIVTDGIPIEYTYLINEDNYHLSPTNISYAYSFTSNSDNSELSLSAKTYKYVGGEFDGSRTFICNGTILSCPSINDLDVAFVNGGASIIVIKEYRLIFQINN